jgi:hypothetical protein
LEKYPICRFKNIRTSKLSAARSKLKLQIG